MVTLALIVIAGWLYASEAKAQSTNQDFVEPDLVGSELLLSGDNTSVPKPDLDNVSTGTLLIRNADSRYQDYTDAPALDSAVRLSISGVVAKVVLEQTYANNTPDWIEGIYAFPLPNNAAINGLTIQVGERTIIGSIAQRQQAKKIYTEAAKAGKIASLVQQNRANLFTTRIANIAPGETVAIVLQYVQTIKPRNETFSLRFPMTLTPRYSNYQVTDAADISPPQIHYQDSLANPNISSLIAIEAVVYGNQPPARIESPSHELRIQQLDGQIKVQVSNSVPMDQDFILNWQPGQQQEPVVSSWKEHVMEDEYLLAMITPPATASLPDHPPRELILVIDTSGSMAGESIKAAKAALAVAIDGLQLGDRFNIIEFNSATRKLFPVSVDATASNLTLARRFTRSLIADGGTEMQRAVQAALANPLRGFIRQLVFVTDGSIGNEEQLFRTIESQLRGARLFTVGIGTAPNAWFMQKAAQLGRGTYSFIKDYLNVESTMSELFRKIESPALTDISIEWIGGDADYAPSPVNDLYAGEPVIVSARLDSTTTGFRISGTLGNSIWESSVNFENSTLVDTGLSTLWARQKIENLLDEQRRESDPDFYKSVITRIAIDHKILSPYTSFVAVDSSPARIPGTPIASKKVPNLMPAGSEMRAVRYPMGAAGSDTLIFIGLALLFIGLCLKAPDVFRVGAVER